jgi:hypothetical protein
MKKAGIACLVLGIVGFLAYTFKTMVIGYFASEQTLLNILGVALIALIAAGILLMRAGAAQDRRNATAELARKHENSQRDSSSGRN